MGPCKGGEKFLVYIQRLGQLFELMDTLSKFGLELWGSDGACAGVGVIVQTNWEREGVEAIACEVGQGVRFELKSA